MLFQNGRFAPHFPSDARLRGLLEEVITQQGTLLKPSDLVAAAIRCGDEGLLTPLRKAVRQGHSVRELQEAAAAPSPATDTLGLLGRPREGFSASALRALAELEGALQAGGGLLDSAASEVLILAAMKNMDDDERRRFAALDMERACDLYQKGAAKRLVADLFEGLTDVEDSSTDHPVDNSEAISLSEVAPVADLTSQARGADPSETFPFDGEPAYDRLFDALARALHRHDARHVLLVGERGVGKSTIVAELARRAALGRIPYLANRRFLTVDCRFFPPEESRGRLAAILDSVASQPDLVVGLEGFPALLRGDWGAGNKPLLLAALAHARCQIIGLLTPRDFEELIVDDADFADFFTRVDVEEPDIEVALKLLRHFALGLERRFGVTIDAEAVRQTVQLSAAYILNDQLPAKALRLLHHVCEDIDYERGQLGAGHQHVTADDMVRAVSQVSGVPEETLRGVAERTDYEQCLRDVIFGQDRAVREVATELGLIKAGMTDPDKPASVMLFLGQTGTGKTELAKALARFYSTSKRLKTYTLGNCVEPHSVATIIGVPPGYVGNDRGGRLVNELNADPYCVFLLDEADKAHPDVLQPFLNLFDEGWVCDQRGVRAYANKSIFILTTNVGQRMIAEMVEQGRGIEEIQERMKEALSQIRHSKSDRPVFTPEFLARIKRIIVFNPLGEEAMKSIARKLVRELQENWQQKRGKALQIPEALVEHLGQDAHRQNDKSKGKEGGRIARKLVAEWIEAPLQREIAQHPDAYRHCAAVALELVPPPPSVPAENSSAAAAALPDIRVCFLPERDA
jgi:ATP-dependent Clp protease ATP-binding subunit ClpA